jgi:hypothetical protein
VNCLVYSSPCCACIVRTCLQMSSEQTARCVLRLVVGRRGSVGGGSLAGAAAGVAIQLLRLMLPMCQHHHLQQLFVPASHAPADLLLSPPSPPHAPGVTPLR